MSNKDNSMKILNGLLKDSKPEPEIEKAIETLEKGISEPKIKEDQIKTYVFEKTSLTMTDCYIDIFKDGKTYDLDKYFVFESENHKKAQTKLQTLVKKEREINLQKEIRTKEKKVAKAQFNNTETKPKEKSEPKIPNTKEVNENVANFYLEFSFDETRLEIFRYILEKLKVIMGDDILNIVIDETKGLYFFQMMYSGALAIGLDIPKTHFNNFYFHDPKYEKIETVKQISVNFSSLLNALKRIPVNKSNHIKFITTVTKPILTVSYRSGSSSITKRIPIMSEEEEYNEALANRTQSIPLEIGYNFKDKQDFNEFKEAYFQWVPTVKTARHVMIQTVPDQHGDGQLMLFSDRTSITGNENDGWETVISTDITTMNGSESEQGTAYYDFDVLEAMLFPFNNKNSLKSHTETLIEYGDNLPMRVIHKFMRDIVVTCLVAPLDQEDEFED